MARFRPRRFGRDMSHRTRACTSGRSQQDESALRAVFQNTADHDRNRGPHGVVAVPTGPLVAVGTPAEHSHVRKNVRMTHASHILTPWPLNSIVSGIGTHRSGFLVSPANPDPGTAGAVARSPFAVKDLNVLPRRHQASPSTFAGCIWPGWSTSAAGVGKSSTV